MWGLCRPAVSPPHQLLADPHQPLAGELLSMPLSHTGSALRCRRTRRCCRVRICLHRGKRPRRDRPTRPSPPVPTRACPASTRAAPAGPSRVGPRGAAFAFPRNPFEEPKPVAALRAARRLRRRPVAVSARNPQAVLLWGLVGERHLTSQKVYRRPSMCVQSRVFCWKSSLTQKPPWEYFALGKTSKRNLEIFFPLHMSLCESYVGTSNMPRASPKGTTIAPHGTTLYPKQVAASHHFASSIHRSDAIFLSFCLFNPQKRCNRNYHNHGQL